MRYRSEDQIDADADYAAEMALDTDNSDNWTAEQWEKYEAEHQARVAVQAERDAERPMSCCYNISFGYGG
jgi:hypothetical protein